MARDDHELCDVWLLYDDKPFDEMAGVVGRLHKACLDRWGRQPYLAELLYPLWQLVTSGADRAVADEQVLSFESLLQLVGGPTAADRIESGNYEAGFDGESNDFLIWPRSAEADIRVSLVVRGEVFGSESGTDCHYEILLPVITDRMARCLIRNCVLDPLLDYDLTNRDHPIQFQRSLSCDLI